MPWSEGLSFPLIFFSRLGMQFWNNTHLESNQSGQISGTPNDHLKGVFQSFPRLKQCR